ncbi:CapA family protein [Martelella sp. AMO21009]
MDDKTLSIFAVGDVFVDIEEGLSAFRHVTPILKTGDIVIGNCEGVYTDRPALTPTVRHPMIAPIAQAHGLGDAPFHVLTCANNHILDAGYAGLSDTLAELDRQGIATTGAGADIDQALRPIVSDVKGRRVAFLAVASVFPTGYHARENRPGLAPLRIETHYAIPDRTFWEPGVPPIIETCAVREDLERLESAIAAARQVADLVIVSCHWGNSSLYEVVQDYETRYARHIVDSGADAVLCHHHHSLRGMEFYNAKPIFYGLGAFVHHFTEFHPSAAQAEKQRADYGKFAHGPREGFPLFPFHPDARMTGIALLQFGPDSDLATGLIPAMVLPDGSTKPYRAGDPDAGPVVEYFEKSTRTIGNGVVIERSCYGDWDFLAFRSLK